ncbi:SAF domain-containing protein [Nocardiopsis dassonvillei]|uniref:SAF domain-containing protein n=1 Tax=Nocardiopsis dassonvillei TaxID=2014 RepID=UPI00201072F6|nr:SAF domain-containing protein [Nocardiopsis dassonvillei]MCK9871414.1 SAF domain-containing protein [Nocardiopsis dassonvillei]
MIWLGAALVLFSALGATAVLGLVDDRVTVVAVAQDVPYGQPLTAQDLTTVRIAADPLVSVIPGDQLQEMVGQVAAADLYSGELLTTAKVDAEHLPASGQHLVPLPLRPSQLPAQGLRAGDVVQIVSTPGEGGEVPSELPPSVTATVVRVGEPDVDGITVVDVQTPATDGAVLAARVATGRIALVVTSPGGA